MQSEPCSALIVTAASLFYCLPASMKPYCAVVPRCLFVRSTRHCIASLCVLITVSDANWLRQILEDGKQALHWNLRARADIYNTAAIDDQWEPEPVGVSVGVACAGMLLTAFRQICHTCRHAASAGDTRGSHLIHSHECCLLKKPGYSPSSFEPGICRAPHPCL